MPRNNTFSGIYFLSNSKIEFLPVRLHLSFPNLRYYDAGTCAIKEISDANFVNLRQLTWLVLEGNLIETVPSEAFDGLIKLQEVDLGENASREFWATKISKT